MAQSHIASLGEPQVIASLPRPYDSKHGTTRSSPVYSLIGTRKRKRNEIIVGIDGEAINIYGIRNPRLVTSYPISPQSLLTAPPCSACCHNGRSSKRRRYTYAALKADHGSTPHRLVGFEEDVTGSSTGLSSTAPKKYECTTGSTNDAVIHITTLAALRDDSHEPCVLTATTTGKLETRTADLADITATLTLADSDPSAQIEYIASHCAPLARHAILRGRSDLTSLMGPTSTDAGNAQDDVTMIIAVAGHKTPNDSTSTQRNAHLIYYSSQQPVGLRLLETWSLPDISSHSETAHSFPTFDFDHASGMLYTVEEGRLTVIELAINARSRHQFQLPQPGNFRILPISKQILLVANQSACYLYDVKYSSVQAIQSLTKPGLEHDRKKRKREEAAVNSGDLDLISWHVKTSTVTLQTGRELSALQITMPKERKNMPQCRLINALGKGSSSKPEEHSMDEDHSMTAKLESMQSCREHKPFEKKFFSLLPTDTETHDLTSPYRVLTLAFRALACMFDWSRPPNSTSIKGLIGTSPLRLSFAPAKVFDWLAAHNYITSSNIKKALHEHKPQPTQMQGSISDFDVIFAIAHHDPSLKLLTTFATSSKPSLEGLVGSLRYFLGSLNSRPATDGPMSITDGQSDTAIDDGHEQIDNTDDEVIEMSLARHDLYLASSLLEPSHAQLRGHALRAILTRLGICHASSSIKRAVRSIISPQETVLLINLLRVELAHSGWTGRTLDFYPSDEQGVKPTDEAIHVIAKLLNCCVDSLGIGGWIGSSLGGAASGEYSVLDDNDHTPHLVALSQETSTETLIGLRETTTATLEAAQESAFFENFLTDFLRYSNNAHAARAGGHHVSASALSIDGQGGPEANMLPLGTRDAAPISRIRVDAGGEIRERSNRDIARKESQRIGRYTFERIRI